MLKVILVGFFVALSGCASWQDFREGAAMSLQAFANNRGQQADYYQGLASQQPVDYYQQYHKNYLNESNNQLLRQQNQILQQQYGNKGYCTVGVNC